MKNAFWLGAVIGTMVTSTLYLSGQEKKKTDWSKKAKAMYRELMN